MDNGSATSSIASQDPVTPAEPDTQENSGKSLELGVGVARGGENPPQPLPLVDETPPEEVAPVVGVDIGAPAPGILVSTAPPSLESESTDPASLPEPAEVPVVMESADTPAVVMPTIDTAADIVEHPPSTETEPAPTHEIASDNVPAIEVPEEPKESVLPPLPNESPEESSPSTENSAIPSAVLALSDGELKIAAAYYLKKNQREFSAKGVQARQEKMNRNLESVISYLTVHGTAPLPRLARKLNLSPNLTSHYLQILIKQDRVKAKGWAKNRKYFV